MMICGLVMDHLESIINEGARRLHHSLERPKIIASHVSPRRNLDHLLLYRGAGKYLLPLY